MERKLTWSYGGGTQSIAIAILIYQGKLLRPDTIIFSDTSRERTSTWEYKDKYIDPLFHEIGLEIDVVPHSYSYVDLYSHSGKLLLPVYTEKGTMPLYCSKEWKQYPVRRRLRELGYGRRNPIITWIGFSRDEFKRMKPSGVKWQEYAWPLIYDYPLHREECAQLVRDFGFPDPPKSSCWMCPYMSDKEWLTVRDNWPDDWEKAKQLEKEIQKDDELYLFWASTSLDELEDIPSDQWEEYITKLRKEKANGHNEEICESGYCFV